MVFPTPAFPTLAIPGATYPSGLAHDTQAPFNLRFEVAFSTDPDAPSPAWVDLSPRVHLPSGITNRRGRGDEFDTSQPGTLQITLENLDGALSPDNTASPYYPNVLPRRRCRLTYRDPFTYGTRNMLAAEDASFEGGTVGAWFPDGAGTALANSTAHVDVGSKALQVTWPTAAAGSAAASLTVAGLAAGRAYTARARVWVTAGSPDVRLTMSGAHSQNLGTPTSTKGAFTEVAVQFTPLDSTQTLALTTFGTGTTAGQLVWLDAVMLDEGTWSGKPFTTTSPADVILPRFDGYVDEWPVEWPDGGQTYSRAQVSAGDILARLGAKKTLRSVVVETAALDGAVVHFPLGEAQGSTQARSVAGDAAILSTVTIGNGAGLTFGSGTGVPTDGAAAPTWSSNGANGTLLQGKASGLNPVPDTATGWAAGPVTLVANVNTTGINSTFAALSDDRGYTIALQILGNGKIAVTVREPSIGLEATLGSSVIGNDGQTHHVAASLNPAGDLTLTVDGGASLVTTGVFPPPILTSVTIGGMPSGAQVFSGTVSHVVVFPSEVPNARLREQRLSTTTGFAGERADQRISRVATWVGLPAARLNLDVGSAKVAHIDPTGLSPLDYLRKVETAEGGNLFADSDGRLTFHNRARSYTPRAVDLTLPAASLGEGTRLVKNLAQVVNDVTGSRTGGALVRQVDAASQAAYGQSSTSLELAVMTDDEVTDAVEWRLNTSKTPLARFTDLQLDGLTDPQYSAAVRAAAIWARITVTDLPSQAPAAQMTQQVQGYTETITDSSWTLSVNATPFAHLSGLILDDATYGVLDANNHIVY
ncbi:MAG TPA: carbohydrate binding domain-containing protein [Phytomonospora sp.]